MKTIIQWAVGAVALAGLAATSAEAMPVTPPSAMPDVGAITTVSGGCGPFGHRGFYGGCQPNAYGPPRGFYGRGPRCFVRYTYFGPRRICRF